MEKTILLKNLKFYWI